MTERHEHCSSKSHGILERESHWHACFIPQTHLKKDPDRSGNTGNGPCDKEEQRNPEDSEDGVLGHGESRLLACLTKKSELMS